ncbi:hypothetical protein [Bacillus sp. UNCCL13]|nr:hypothetical protein [Bacillus sp. UNCCL13]
MNPEGIYRLEFYIKENSTKDKSIRVAAFFVKATINPKTAFNNSGWG